MSTKLPCLLILDTATEVVHLALVAQGQVRVRAVGGGAQASVSTLPEMQALLAEAGLAWAQVDAIGFGRGPGAFTGLRTACAVTQGLALALDKPVLSLDTLMAVAESARAASSELDQTLRNDPQAVLWVLQDARMREVYAAPYAWTPVAGWLACADVQLWPLDHARAQIASGAVRHAAGSALAAYTDEIDPAGQLSHALPQARPDGQALAVLAQAAWARGELLDAALALPLYVRDKVAQTTQERAASRLAAQEALPAP